MIINKETFEWYCETCDSTNKFIYVSSNVATAGRPEQHFYTCDSMCGRSYERRQMLSLKNIRRIHSHTLEKCCK